MIREPPGDGRALSCRYLILEMWADPSRLSPPAVADILWGR